MIACEAEHEAASQELCEEDGKGRSASPAPVLPPAVRAGGRVSIIAPAGPPSADALAAGCDLLRSWGLEPVVHPQVHLRRGYLAGADEERAHAVLDAFSDGSTTAVICAKGGYGCTRLLPLLDAAAARAAPGPFSRLILSKRLFGFSDITALHRWIRTAAPGCVSFHSPMPASALMKGATEASHLALRRALFEEYLPEACPPLQVPADGPGGRERRAGNRPPGGRQPHARRCAGRDPVARGPHGGHTPA